MIGTSVKYWLNLQNECDELIFEFKNKPEIQAEKDIFKSINYAYFRDNFNLPDILKKTDDQIKNVRDFLNVSSLTVFKNADMYVRFRSSRLKQLEQSVIKANIMVQIAANLSMKKIDIPKFVKKRFLKSIEYALTLTKQHNNFYQSGVDLIILPNLAGSKINGATKK